MVAVPSRLLRAYRRLRASPKPAPVPPFPQVETFSWRPQNGAVNFGDHLARIVPAQLLAGRGYTLDDEVARAVRLFTVGSVLHFAGDGDLVWGSGVNGKIDADRHRFAYLDVRAVRGPLTAEFLRKRGIACPDVFGDPGLLVGTLFADRFRCMPEHDYVFVPNLHDLALVAGDPHVVSPLLGWNRVVAAIARARLVLASSLHGLVIADALGIPSRYVRLSETEALFKYQDYALGAGRASIEPAASVAAALEMGGTAPAGFDPAPLIAAFPWELWEHRFA